MPNVVVFPNLAVDLSWAVPQSKTLKDFLNRNIKKTRPVAIFYGFCECFGNMILRFYLKSQFN